MTQAQRYSYISASKKIFSICLFLFFAGNAYARSFIGGKPIEQAYEFHAENKIKLEETGAGNDDISIQAPASISSNYTLTLPDTDGNNGEALTTNGSGVLSWTSLGSLHDAVTLDVNADTLLSLSTQELGLDTQTQNTVFAGSDGAGDAVPAFRALTSNDIPDLSSFYLKLDQTTPQTVINGIPLLDASFSDITDPDHFVNKEYVDISVASLAFNYYLTDTSSDIGSYYEMVNMDTGEATSTLTTGSLSQGDDQLIFTWATPSGEPNFNTLKAGNYLFHVHAYKDSPGAKPVTFYWTLSERTAGGSETLRITSETSSELSDSSSHFNISGSLADDVDINLTDRLVIKLYANVGATGTDPQVSVEMEGLEDSNIRIAVDSGILSDVFLRRDGTTELTGNWDAGSYSITANNFISDIVTGTSPYACTSTTLNTNLNADLLDGQHGSYYEAAFTKYDLAGTANQISLSASGTGVLLARDITLSLPQDIATSSSPTFADLTLSAPVNIYNLSHDSFADFVANEHIDHTSVTLTAGNGLTGGGDISASRSFAVGAGTGIAVNADDVALSHLGLESLTDPGADRIAFWDDSETAFKWLVPNTGLAISTTNLNVTADYSVITANDAGTDVTAAELEELTDGSDTSLHTHSDLANTDEKVKIDAAATAGYIGAASNDGVLRADATLDYTDGGDYITLGLDSTLKSNYDTAYSHSQDNTQAHSDYLLNNANDTTSGILTSAGFALTNSAGNLINHTAQSEYDKIRVWNSSSYTIGMVSGQSFGALNDYAMTFTMNDDADRGFLWRDSSDAASDGAMSLTTGGILTVKSTGTFNSGSNQTVLGATGTTYAGTARPQRSFYLPAAAWYPTQTSGCASLTKGELPTNDVNIPYLAFDGSTDEYASTMISMPKSWDGGTINYVIHWSAPTGSGNVYWYVQGRCYADSDALDQSWGTAVSMVDTYITAYDVHITGESGAVTLAGSSPAGERLVVLRLYRGASADSHNADALFLGMLIKYTATEESDD